MVTEAAITFPKVQMFCNQVFRKTEDNSCRQQNAFQVTKLQLLKDPTSSNFDTKTAEQLLNCLDIAAVRRETSQRSLEHRENVCILDIFFYIFYIYISPSTLRFLQQKKPAKRPPLSKERSLSYSF